MVRARTVPPVLVILTALALCACSGDADSRANLASFDEFHRGIMDAGIFSGGPDRWFEEVGRKTLADCIEYGLEPHHRVLDVGAGALRVGWWLVHYIDPSRYHAIEPVRERIDTAASILGSTDIHLHYNDDWEFPDETFDFVLARSIWTHASKWMITKMLAEFAESAAPGGRFLTSVFLARSREEDYIGDEWVGKIEKDDTGGGVMHSLSWIEQECARFGLSVEVGSELQSQRWLLIRKGR